MTVHDDVIVAVIVSEINVCQCHQSRTKSCRVIEKTRETRPTVATRLHFVRLQHQN